MNSSSKEKLHRYSNPYNDYNNEYNNYYNDQPGPNNEQWNMRNQQQAPMSRSRELLAVRFLLFDLSMRYFVFGYNKLHETRQNFLYFRHSGDHLF